MMRSCMESCTWLGAFFILFEGRRPAVGSLTAACMVNPCAHQALSFFYMSLLGGARLTTSSLILLICFSPLNGSHKKPLF